MTYCNLMGASAILSMLYGLGFILMPGQLVRLYNVDLTPVGIYVAQLYGSSLPGFGLLDWFARSFHDNNIQRSVLIANLLGAGLAMLFSVTGVMGDVPEVNALGWTTVALYLLFTLAFGILLFRGR